MAGVTNAGVPRDVPVVWARPALRERDGDGDRRRFRQRQDAADDDVRTQRATAQPADVRQRSGDVGPRRAPPVRRRSGRPHRHQPRVSGGEGHPQGRGAAVAANPLSSGRSCEAAVREASPYGVPVTAKFRMGLWGHHAELRAHGEICAEAGVTWIAVRAPSVEQHYASKAHSEAIGELKRAVPAGPGTRQRRHLAGIGRGRDDPATGCDGVVVGRGCLGRPWLFGDLIEAMAGRQMSARRHSWQPSSRRWHATHACSSNTHRVRRTRWETRR